MPAEFLVQWRERECVCVCSGEREREMDGNRRTTTVESSADQARLITKKELPAVQDSKRAQAEEAEEGSRARGLYCRHRSGAVEDGEGKGSWSPGARNEQEMLILHLYRF